MSEKVIRTCDVSKAEHSGSVRKVNITVVCLTEWNEGRAVPPYLENVKIDICKGCEGSIIRNRRLLLATGAMGYNDYYFDE